ncbi:hypothetical protein H7691_02570 [Stenotrophomonas sp. CW117]|jgi:hypothetical protein|uniref:hypothetical protein n=1 Tax=Stenotrophomonas TaxID=40323 RepID=UPI000AF0D991|nr:MULTISPECIES: hypothetical protein [Stenotrophomonas]QOF99059.1 hypothetical protein H7691_02570 [Stenotrophomonas sp. CW117]
MNRLFQRLGSAQWINRATVLLVVLACGNALLFSLAAATPLIQADGWDFLEYFLPRYFDGSMGILDLFMKRNGIDHAQPLQKLVLLFHTHFFDMDFRIEGLIGVLFGIVWCTIIAAELLRLSIETPGQRVIVAIGVSLVFALGLSLNSTNVFTWPLVTLGYIALLLATAYFVFAMNRCNRPQPLQIFVATAALGMCIDSQAIVALLATMMALAPMQSASRREAWRQALAAVAGLLAARLCLWLIARHTGLEGGAGLDWRALASTFTKPDAITGLLIPFSDSLIHAEHLAKHFPENQSLAMAACAAIIISLHVWFWARTYFSWRNNRYTRITALSVFLMLLSYGMTASIIIGRVTLFDWSYLHQPRYVQSYQVSLVALAIMLQAVIREARPSWNIRLVEPASGIVVIACLFSVQLLVSRESWILPQYLTPYWQNAALAMQRVANAPQAATGQCPDIMYVCGYPPERRKQLMDMLVQRKLNVFSTSFQMRNRLYPELKTIPGFSGAEAAQPSSEVYLEAEQPAEITVSSKERCATPGSLMQVTIDIRTNNLANQDAQLWLEAVGGSRQLLDTTPANSGAPVRLIKQLPNKSHLMLVGNGDGIVLAQADLNVTECAAAAP